MTQIADSHSRLEFAHLGVSAHGSYRLLIADPVVFEILQLLHQRFLSAACGTALNCVKDLGRMKAENGNIPEAGGGSSIQADTEGMRRIVDQLQSVPFRDFADFPYGTHVSIYMYRENGDSFFTDQSLDQCRIHGQVLPADIAEDRHQIVAHDRMCRGCKSKGSRDHLASRREAECPDRFLQGKMSVREQSHMGHIQVRLQPLLKSIMFGSHVGEPAALP